MAFIEPMHRNKPNITYLLTDLWFKGAESNVNTLRPRQNGRHFADDIFKCIFLNENIRITLKISLKFVPEVRINNIPALVQIMAWRRPGDKLLSEPMMVSLLTHICVTRPQWINQASRDKWVNHGNGLPFCERVPLSTLKKYKIVLSLWFITVNPTPTIWNMRKRYVVLLVEDEHITVHWFQLMAASPFFEAILSDEIYFPGLHGAIKFVLD